MSEPIKTRNDLGSINLFDYPCRFKYNADCRRHAPVPLPVNGGQWRTEASRTHYPNAKCPCGEYERTKVGQLTWYA